MRAPGIQASVTKVNVLKGAVKGILGKLGLQVRRADGGWWIGARRSSIEPGQKLFEPRFGWTSVSIAVTDATRRWPDRQVVVLVDFSLPADVPPVESVFCGRDPVAKVLNFALNKTVFVYACDSDDIGLPYVREIVDGSGTFIPVQVFTPARFSNIDEIARQSIAAEYDRQTTEGFQKFDFGAGDSLNLLQAISVTSHLPGAYLEVGCFRGSSACVALAYMRERVIERNCYFLDVFDGFDYQAARESADATWLGTHATEGVAKVSERIVASSDPDKGLRAHVLKKNIIEDDLPADIGEIVVANIDVDLYEAVFAALVRVAPRMVSGGIIVVEDPGHTPALIGSRLALEEFLALPIAQRFSPLYMESGQTFLINIGVDSLDKRSSRAST